MPAYPREELEAMVERWLEANRRAQDEGNWVRHLGPLYTEDAEYRWTVGPSEEFVARGRGEIERWALGEQMEGFEGWSYPYERVIIDDRQGEVVGFWRQVSPARRPDGEPYQVAGVGGSWFRYGGDGKWSWQRDFFDLASVLSCLAELAAAGELSPPLKRKISTMARGGKLGGHEKTREIGLRDRVRQGVAMAKVSLLGR